MIHVEDSCLDPTAPLGRGMRYGHECSTKDKPLVVTRTAKGWVWWCHRCEDGGGTDAMHASPAKALAHVKNLKLQPVQNRSNVTLPNDFVMQIPAKGLAWLYNFGITDEDIAEYTFGYSPYLDRLIMPVYWCDELVYWQGRNLGEITWKNPKYLNIKQYGRKDLYFFVQQDTVGRSASIVVCEDILSTIIVGRTSDAVAVLSAHVSDKLIRRLNKRYDRILLWLDPDKLIEMMQWRMHYQSLGFKVEIVRSVKDPKYYTEKEIKHYVYGL